MNGNHVEIEGNLVRDPELKFTPSGKAVCTCSVARSYRVGGPDGEEQVDYFDFVAFDQLSENIVLSLSKGTRVVLSGTLKQNRWTTDDGQNRSRVEIRVDAIGPSLRWASASVTKNEKAAPQAELAPEDGVEVGF